MRSLLHNETIIVQWHHYCTMRPLLYNEITIAQWDHYCTETTIVQGHYCTMRPLLYNEITIAQWDHYCTVRSLLHNETTIAQWDHYCTMRPLLHNEITIAQWYHYSTMRPLLYNKEAGIGLWCWHYFQQYFNKIMSQFYWWKKPGYLESKPPMCRKSLTNYNVVSSTSRLSWIQTRNISGDRHWLNS